MTATSEETTAPTPEEIGAGYDQFTDLANRAQERQTEYHIRTIGLKAHEHLLDIGCGTGLPAVRVAQRSGGRVTGINVSRAHLARAERTARSMGMSDRVSFRYGNAMDLDFPNESFDAAMAIDVYAHLSDRQQAFHETARVLRPGGHFMMSEFTARGTPPAAELAAYRQVWNCMPPITPARAVELAAGAGFELVRAENMTQNVAFNGQLMGLLYTDRHDEIVARYGPELVAEMDATVPLVRSFVSDHLGYYLFLFRKPR